MNNSSLQSLEEQLQGTTSTFSSEDWNVNRDILARIRALTFEPREHARGLPKRGFVGGSANSLPELLDLPVNGSVSSEETEPVLATLRSESDIVEHCNDEGMKPRAVAVAKEIFRSLDQHREIYTNVWHGSGFYQNEGTTVRRLLEAHDTIINEGHINGARYRINALILACLYHARVQDMGPIAKRETIVLDELMEESGKSRSHITTVLKRGRWYALWVSRLGLGAILTLGESFASSNQMQDIDHLVKTCRAMHGYCERSRDLSGFARKAIEQAISLSGAARDKSTALGSGHRYIEDASMPSLPSNDRNGSSTSSIAHRQNWYTLPPLHNVTEQCAGGGPMPARFSTPGSATMALQGRSDRDLRPRLEAEVTRRSETVAQTAPVTEQPYIDYPDVTGIRADDEVESATLSIARGQTLNSLPPMQEVNEHHAAGEPTPASFSLRDPVALGGRLGDVPNLQSQWQPDVELAQRRAIDSPIASFRPAANADNPTHATLPEADETLLLPGAARYPGSNAQACFATNQGYDGGVGLSAWEGTTFNTHCEDLNPDFWDINFPPYN